MGVNDKAEAEMKSKKIYLKYSSLAEGSNFRFPLIRTSPVDLCQCSKLQI